MLERFPGRKAFEEAEGEPGALKSYTKGVLSVCEDTLLKHAPGNKLLFVFLVLVTAKATFAFSQIKIWFVSISQDCN